MIAFLTSRLGLALVAALAVGVGLIWFYLDAKAAGAAAVTAAALAKAAERVAAAQKARSEVKDTKEAIDADPFNRDRG